MAKSDETAAVQDMMTEQAAAQKKGKSGSKFAGSKTRRTEEVSRVESGGKVADTERPHGDRTARITLTIKPELKTELKVYCAQNKVTAASLMEQLLQEFLKKHK